MRDATPPRSLAAGSDPSEAEALQRELVSLRARVAELEVERSARQDAERALRGSESRYRALVSQCPDSIVVHQDGIIAFVNEAGARMAGCAVAELVGRQVLDFVHPDQQALARAQLAEVAAGAAPLEMVQNRVRAPDGRELYTEAVERRIDFGGRPAIQVVVRDVTARVEAERALREMQRSLEQRVEERTAELSAALDRLARSEARLRALVEASPDTLVRIGKDGRILDVEPGADLERHLDGAAFRGRTLREVLPPPLAARGLDHVREVLETGEMQTYYYRYPTASGGRDFEARVVPSGADEVALVVRDVTEQRQAEEALRASEARHRALLRATPDTLVRLSREGQVLDFRAGVGLESRTFRLADFVGKAVEEFLPPEIGQQSAGLLRRVLDSGEPVTFEYTSPNLAGYEMEARLVRSGPDEVLAAIRDVTERRRSEEALRDSELRFRAVFEEAPHGMAVVGEGRRLVQANRMLGRILGEEASALRGRSSLALLHPDDRAEALELERQLAQQDRATVTAELRYRTDRGEDIPVRLTAAVLRLDRRGPVGLLMVEDLRERNRAAAVLREYEEKLRRSERLVSTGTLAAGIAHEINNPIGSILLAAQFALHSPEAGGFSRELRESIEDVERHARRCGQVVKSVLQFARQEWTERVDCDLNHCLANARDLCGPVARETEVGIDVEPCPELLPVRIDPTGIEQVLLNVIRNAAQASPPGSRIGVTSERVGGRARVRVRDRGRGMTEAERTYLFDPFYTTRREEGGTGLGLSIAHGIVTDFGGSIQVESQPGAGTEVTIELPLTCPPREESR